MGTRDAIGWKGVLVILACFGIYLIGNDRVGLWDRDEPRYAQTSRQMLQSGDWIVPRFLDQVRTAKPVLIYWCQASAMKVFGDNTFAARFPSAVSMALLLVVLAVVIGKTIGPARAFWTIFILGTSVLAIASGKICLTDAVLLLFITIAQMCLYALWQGKARWWVVWTMWIAIGLAALTKGPVVIGVQLATLLTLAGLNWATPRTNKGDLDPSGNRASLPALLWRTQPWIGLLIIAIIVGPWLYLINERASEFISTTLKHDVWSRILKPLEGHAGPPGYHFITVWGTFLPWSLFIPAAIGLAWRHRRLPTTRFALAAVIGPWLMMEIVQTKLPHYLLPVFPALAFLAADMLVRAIRGQHDALTNLGAKIGISIFCLIIALLGLVPWLMLTRFPETPVGPMVAVSVLTIVLGLIVLIQFLHERLDRAALVMGFGMLGMVGLAYAYVLPRTPYLRLPQRTAEVLIAHKVNQVGQAYMMDYKEPSLAFHQGGSIFESRDFDFNPKFVDRLPQWMVMSSDLWDAAPKDLQDRYEIVAVNRGLSYADEGKTVLVMVVRRKRP